MANTVSVTLTGAEELRNILKQVDLQAQSNVKQVVNYYALQIASTAKKLAPVRKAVYTVKTKTGKTVIRNKNIGGRLRASIRPKFLNNGLSAEVGSDVAYAAFVEFGTGREGASSAGNHEGKPDTYVYGPKRGMRAQPFLWPAIERHKKEYLEDMAAAVMKP